jgi:protein-arginine kinase activator protein McsA
MQGDASHVGKVPLGVENSVSIEYDRLKKELEKAIELEEYEQAGIIRDRMRQLKGE